MRKIFICILAILVSGCAKKSEKDSSSHGDRTTTSTSPPTVRVSDITLRASRDYRPDEWVKDKVTSPVTEKYEVPKKLELIAGNAGRAWASLYIGYRKFCYEQLNLKYEKMDPSSPCSTDDDTLEYETSLVIGQGQVARLDFEGGHCGSHCHYTEVEAIIKLRQ